MDKDSNVKKLRAVALTVVVITSFTMSITGSALNLSIPQISIEYGVEASVVGWMITGYMLVCAALSVPFGRLADITCRKYVLVIGVAVFIAGCAGSVFSVNMPMLLGTRIIQGIGGAMVLSSNTPILLNAYPPHMKGHALGYSIGAVYIGLSMGPVIGGVLNQYLGWRSVFIFAGGLALIAFVVAIAGLPAIKSDQRDMRMDYVGSVLFVAFIVLFMLGLSNVGGGIIPIGTAAIGVLLGIGFIAYEIRISNPILDVSIFRSNIGYTLSNISALLNYAATFAISYLTSIYLQVILGYESHIAGFILITQPLIMAILTPKMGRMSDRHSPFKMSSFGMGLCAVGSGMFIFVGENTSIVYVMAALMITGLGYAFFSSPNTNAVMSCVEPRNFGVATSVLNTMRSVGQTTSMVIVTIIVSIMIPGVELAKAQPQMLIKVINTSFIIFAAMCVIGIFISLQRKKD